MTKYELQDYLSRISPIEPTNIIEATACNLRASKRASEKLKKNEFSKQEENEKLIQYIDENNLWFNEKIDKQFFAEGAEQKVYLNFDGKSVIKLNDSIFYTSWIDYFNSLLLHNLFFSKTSYKLIGLQQIENILFAITNQAFVVATEKTNLLQVEELLLENDFKRKRNNDYYNQTLGIIWKICMTKMYLPIMKYYSS